MNITFNDKELEQLAHDDRKRAAKMGKVRAKKYKQRLDDISAAITLADLAEAPGKYHELIENRKGQWACDLDQPYRLIFRPHESPIPINPHGGYIWSEIRGVEILEIDNYHKK